MAGGPHLGRDHVFNDDDGLGQFFHRHPRVQPATNVEDGSVSVGSYLGELAVGLNQGTSFFSSGEELTFIFDLQLAPLRPHLPRPIHEDRGRGDPNQHAQGPRQRCPGPAHPQRFIRRRAHDHHSSAHRAANGEEDQLPGARGTVGEDPSDNGEEHPDQHRQGGQHRQLGGDGDLERPQRIRTGADDVIHLGDEEPRCWNQQRSPAHRLCPEG